MIKQSNDCKVLTNTTTEYLFLIINTDILLLLKLPVIWLDSRYIRSETSGFQSYNGLSQTGTVSRQCSREVWFRTVRRIRPVSENVDYIWTIRQ